MNYSYDSLAHFVTVATLPAVSAGAGEAKSAWGPGRPSAHSV